MRPAATSESFAYSFADLMTSLMIIFILLLLVFLDRQAGVDATATDALLAALRSELAPRGVPPSNIQPASDDPFTVVVSVPGELMNFETNRSALSAGGEEFLRHRTPDLAAVLCSPAHRPNVETVVVEGHSDSAPFRGMSLAESQNQNLKLSQDRSIEVVKSMLAALESNAPARQCLLEKLSASGRGEQDLEATADRSRRVLFRIRVRASLAGALFRLP